MKLDDLRRRIPVEDRAAYDAAYAEATAAGRLGDAVHRLREAAGLSEAALAERVGVGEEEIAAAEEGDPSVTVAFVAQLARALGVPVCLTLGEEVVDLAGHAEPGAGA